MPVLPVFAARMETLDVSMATLAQHMGVTRAHVYRLLQGQTPNPGVQTLHRLALALDLPPASVYAAFIPANADHPTALTSSASTALPAPAPTAAAPRLARIDGARNSLVLQGHGAVALRGRSVGAVLAALWDLSRRGELLTLAALQRLATKAKAATHTPALGRTQVLRLMGGLKNSLDAAPYWPWRLAHAPRQASTGPWWLELKPGASPCVVELVGAAEVLAKLGFEGAAGSASAVEKQHSSGLHPSPRLLMSEHTSAVDLCALVRAVVISDAFAQEGDLANALTTLPSAFDFDISAEAAAVLALRRLHLHRRMGDLAAAHAVLRQWLTGPLHPAAVQTDPFWADRWAMALERLNYDGQPGVYWPKVIERARHHQPTQGPDARVAAEWHNLQALALRRAMMARHEGTHAPADAAAAHQAHRLAFLHYETVLYHALCAGDPDRFHAYIVNVAYHMQKAYRAVGVTPHEVLQWCELSTTLDDKLDSGHDDVWDALFFAEFWLDHQHELPGHFPAALSQVQPTSGQPSQHHPANAAFYEVLLQRTQRLHNPRQRVEAHVLQWRWAKLQVDPTLALALEEPLRQLLQQHPDIHQLLLDEGQGQHLPAAPNA